MQNLNKLSLTLCLALVFTLFSCQKESDPEVEGDYVEASIMDGIGKVNNRNANDYTKIIINPIVEVDYCTCPVAGTIELYWGDVLEATIDFGDGECDNLATKIVGDQIYVFEMDCGQDDYTKVVVVPVLYNDTCGCPVAGTVQYLDGDVLVYTIDYGDGACDNLATKIVGDEIFVFEMDCMD